MPPDNSTHLITAARQRHELTRAKAIRAMRELDHAGAAITFDAVARAARRLPLLALHPARHPRRDPQAARGHACRTRDQQPCQPHNERPQNRCDSAWPSCRHASTTSSRRTSA